MSSKSSSKSGYSFSFCIIDDENEYEYDQFSFKNRSNAPRSPIVAKRCDKNFKIINVRKEGLKNINTTFSEIEVEATVREVEDSVLCADINDDVIRIDRCSKLEWTKDVTTDHVSIPRNKISPELPKNNKTSDFSICIPKFMRERWI
jgi:hypothetical protein